MSHPPPLFAPPAPPLTLKTARILVTNDDGIHAPGIKVLERIAKALSEDVWVVAPESEQSAVAHALTTRRPLRTHKLGRRRFAVDGTPTDSVLVAVHKLIPGKRPDLVLSGINHGTNMAEDVHYSGTVAAALEATLLGCRAVALSQARQPDGSIDWAASAAHAPAVLRKLATMTWPPDVLINVNFPGVPPEAVTAVRACRQGRRVDGTGVVDAKDPSGRPYVWIGDFPRDLPRGKRTDLTALSENAISVTPLHLDLTHRRSLKGLAEIFG